jgi:hypothetical protein
MVGSLLVNRDMGFEVGNEIYDMSGERLPKEI